MKRGAAGRRRQRELAPFGINLAAQLARPENQEKFPTRKAFFDAAGTSSAVLGNYETGGRPPPMDFVERAAELLGCSVEELSVTKVFRDGTTPAPSLQHVSSPASKQTRNASSDVADGLSTIHRIRAFWEKRPSDIDPTKLDEMIGRLVRRASRSDGSRLSEMDLVEAADEIVRELRNESRGKPPVPAREQVVEEHDKEPDAPRLRETTAQRKARERRR